MKKSKSQGRTEAKHRSTTPNHTPSTLTVGDLISAAFETLGDSAKVVRVLGSAPLSERVGLKLVFV